MPKSVLRAVLGRMQFTLHATRRTPHGASRLVQAMPAWLVKTRRAPSWHSRDARVDGHMTSAMHELSTLPPSPPTPPYLPRSPPAPRPFSPTYPLVSSFPPLPWRSFLVLCRSLYRFLVRSSFFFSPDFFHFFFLVRVFFFYFMADPRGVPKSEAAIPSPRR